ncbi:hypothetical protein F8388_005434 [Cannabis sativa]|uniref:CCHC-type domain-containing protein n=1 Tax=Cannabis sativa TaxID=3483 RepID=A0A7J6HB13_CANSA|nr:hypothetical protein F8388_005434 [Cannabis sativa]KAF4400672.1 hypothetical protein G4B88_023080 [Cannabis sativa]
MEELLAKTNKLHVSDEEDWEVDHSLSTMIAKYNLRGRLCSKVDHSRGFLKNLLGRIWKLKESEWNIKIQEKFTTGMFLTFSFNSEQTQSRILARMPWYLSNGVLILGKIGNSSDSWKNELNVFPIWGRALGVPIDYLTEKNTTRLASMAGSVINVQNSDVSRMVEDGFFRFQVWMSINKPICPGFLLPCTGHKKWVAFKYDNLPFMCFRCGWIGHSQKDCSLDIKEVIGEDGKTAMAYGTWLKTDSGVRDGFQMVKDGNKETIMVQEKHIQGTSNQSTNISMGNSFEPLLTEETGREQRRCEVFEGNEVNQDNREMNKLQITRGLNQQHEKEGDRTDMAQDGRGKRNWWKTKRQWGLGNFKEQQVITCNKMPSKELNGILASILNTPGSRKTCAMMSSLLNNKDEWNIDTLNNYFHKEDVPWILGIPIDTHSEDMLIWPFTKDGNYIVKSGYRVAREINLTPTRSSNMDQTHAWWKMWWSLNLPPRMKLFDWKMCRNWLPAKTNLVHRGMKINPICTNCDKFEKTLSHALWNCEKVKKVWKLMPSYKLIKDSRGNSMMDLLVEFKHKLAKEEFEDVVKVLWAIWENRNRQWTNQHTMHGARLLEWVFNSYPRETHGQESLAKMHSATENNQWQTPPDGTYCVHCDAALKPNQEGVGIGYVWQDWKGNILSAGMKYKPIYCNVNIAEAQAVAAALQDKPKSVH